MGLISAALVTPIALDTADASATPRGATVLLASGSTAAETQLAERLSAELQSAGYQVYETDPAADTACATLSAVARSLASYGESAWMQVSIAEGSGQASVSICYRDESGRLSESARDIAPRDIEHGALASVEALNGLRAQPAPAQPCVKVTATPIAEPKPRVPSALAAGVAIVFDPRGIGPIVGATGTLKSGISRHLSLNLDGFVPARAQRIARVDRTVDVDIAWLRAGPSLTWPLWITNVNGSLAAGPALVWADSRATPPLVGSARHTTAFVLSAGGSVELPRDAAWFLRAYYEVGTIVPRVNVTAGPSDTEHFGPLLFQLGANLGIRWND